VSCRKGFTLATATKNLIWVWREKREKNSRRLNKSKGSRSGIKHGHQGVLPKRGGGIGKPRKNEGFPKGGVAPPLLQLARKSLYGRNTRRRKHLKKEHRIPSALGSLSRRPAGKGKGKEGELSGEGTYWGKKTERGVLKHQCGGEGGQKNYESGGARPGTKGIWYDRREDDREKKEGERLGQGKWGTREGAPLKGKKPSTTTARRQVVVEQKVLQRKKPTSSKKREKGTLP